MFAHTQTESAGVGGLSDADLTQVARDLAGLDTRLLPWRGGGRLGCGEEFLARLREECPELEPLRLSEELDRATVEAIWAAARADAEHLASDPVERGRHLHRDPRRGVADLAPALGLSGRRVSGAEAAEVLWPLAVLDLPLAARLRVQRGPRALRQARRTYLEALAALGAMGGGTPVLDGVGR